MIAIASPSVYPTCGDEPGNDVTNGSALLNPVMKLVFEKLANDTEKQMVSVLNGLPE